jgi:hypothetical protein
LDPNVPDNQILSVAMKYKDWDAYIISDDGVFRLTSLAQNIQPITSKDFIASHKDSFKSLNDRIKEYNATGSVPYQEISEANRSRGSGSNPAQTQTGNPVHLAGSHTEPENDELSIDSLPLNELRKYVPNFGTQELSFLISNKVKTIGDFRKLTESRVSSMKAKGKRSIYRNTVASIVRRMDEIIPLIKLP